MAVNFNKILVADAVDQACIDLLTSNGFQVDSRPKLPKDVLLKEIKNYDGLIVRSQTQVTADVMQASSLRVIGRAGTGVDNIDVDAATRKGIIVLNTPGGNSVSACELTCTLIMCLARNVTQGCQSLKEGRWDRALYTGNELSGKTLAIIGLGRIGREVATRMQAFGMKTIGFDPMVSHPACKAANIEKFDNIEDLYPHADYITVHTPLIPQTRNLLNARTLGLCKKGVKIVNVARGGIIDEEALLDALQSGQCSGAAIDVFMEEPPKYPAALKLIAHPKVVVTPHLGASTKEAQVRVAIEVAEQFIALKNLQSRYTVTGVVNAPILVASQNPANTPWIELTKNLGKYAVKLSKIEDLSSANVTVTSHGDELKGMNFLSTAALVGMLTGRTKNGLNLINAPALANEAGLKVTVSHVPGPENNITISVAHKEEHSISGTIQGSNTFITAIDDAQFCPGVPVNSNIILFQGSNAGLDFQKIVEEVSKKGLSMKNVAIAVGKKVWFAVQISEQDSGKTVSQIPGVEVF